MKPQLAATANGCPLGNEYPPGWEIARDGGGRSRAMISLSTITITGRARASTTIAIASGGQRGHAGRARTGRTTQKTRSRPRSVTFLQTGLSRVACGLTIHRVTGSYE